MKLFLQKAICFISERFNERFAEAANGIEDRDLKRVVINCGCIIFWAVVLVLVGLFTIFFIVDNFDFLVVACFLVTAVYSVMVNIKSDDDKNGEPDSIDIMMAEQEAEENHEDFRGLTYNCIVEVSEITSIRCPRDEFSIETSREVQYRMEGDMAIHQFEVDHEGQLDRGQVDMIIREMQRHVNKFARRYPTLLYDGRPPVVYDIKPTGSFFIVEIVLCKEEYKNKIEARKRARVMRQLNTADTYDQDF